MLDICSNGFKDNSVCLELLEGFNSYDLVILICSYDLNSSRAERNAVRQQKRYLDLAAICFLIHDFLLRGFNQSSCCDMRNNLFKKYVQHDDIEGKWGRTMLCSFDRCKQFTKKQNN